MPLDAIGIVSFNLEQTIRFYKLLGIHLQKTGGPDHYEAKTSSGLRLMADSIELIKKLNPTYQKPNTSTIVLCFKQDTPAKVDELFNTITQAGFKGVKDPWDAFWGQRYASVEDPDHNQVDLFADL